MRASALERLGAHLAADENFGRKLSKDAARALNGVDYLTDREKHILAGLDKRAWGALAEASDKFRVAAGKRGLAGVPSGSSQLGDYLNGFKFGGGGGAYGWGDVKTPDGPGITLGSGKTVGGQAGGGATSGSAPRGSDDGGRSGGSGHFGNYGGYTGHGNAGDPKSPAGGTIGERPGGGGGGSPFQTAADSYTGVGMHGDPYGGGGISGGRLPSRAVLAGSGWEALHPGAAVSDDPTFIGPPPPPKPTDVNYMTEENWQQQKAIKRMQSDLDTQKTKNDSLIEAAHDKQEFGVGLANVGIGAGLFGALGAVFGGTGGAYVGMWAGAAIGGALTYKNYGKNHGDGSMPADTDLTGGSGGPAGPRARALPPGQYYMPADDATGTSPTGPRSHVLRSLRSAAFYFPSDDATGTPPGPRSRSGPEGTLYMPAPDDPRPGNPHSRELAAAGIMPY